MARFAKYAWGVLAANLGVVLWGAYVRASGSGAGCGSHWPLCTGVVIPQSPGLATLIELTHRATSGVALLLVVGLFVWSRRVAPAGSPVRLGAGLALVFMLCEALIGAALVKLELVAQNASLTRAVYLATHLLNTFLLLGSLALAAWWASGGEQLRVEVRRRLPWLFAAALLGTLVVGMSGAITALGDTLFPPASLVEGIRQDASPTAHLLVRLRVLHPALAVAVGLYLIVLATSAAAQRGRVVKRLAWAVGGLVVTQWLAGLTNIALLAPVWLQLVHLLLADLLWIALVLLGAAALAQEASARAAVPTTEVAGETAAGARL
ncbi:MAG TPA: COX15/CtaA family protein [Gemmatimonadales bacterium]|nr:COX15/CtaA family protein [Gemmatimonadales bacterium]